MGGIPILPKEKKLTLYLNFFFQNHEITSMSHQVASASPFIEFPRRCKISVFAVGCHGKIKKNVEFFMNFYKK